MSYQTRSFLQDSQKECLTLTMEICRGYRQAKAAVNDPKAQPIKKINNSITLYKASPSLRGPASPPFKAEAFCAKEGTPLRMQGVSS